jgi:hypothetical protein
MSEYRSESGMFVGTADTWANTFHVKTGVKQWVFLIPPEGLVVETRKGNRLPEKTYIPYHQNTEQRVATTK